MAVSLNALERRANMEREAPVASMIRLQLWPPCSISLMASLRLVQVLVPAEGLEPPTP